MPQYSLSPIFEPQYIGSSAAALTFAPVGGTAVPASVSYQISVMRVANKTNAPVTFKCWRVPSGASDDDQHIVVPTINIPVATQTFPQFDVTALWGAVLNPGDAIWCVAGSGSDLVVQADGLVVTQ